MSRITRHGLLAASAMALTLSLAGCAGLDAGASASRTLRAAPHTGLTTLDPITTTAYITRSHGYLVYDTLFGLDQNLEPQPQMVGSYQISPDRRTYTFRLRDGLTWHDGTPVTAEDCVASLRRWGARDGVGQAMMANTASLRATGARTIVLQLHRADPTVLHELGKISSNVPFMMPRRIATTNPNTPITNPIGSGPFRFVAGEFRPGQRAVYERFAGYVPRTEPTSLAAGSRAGQVDRIEWIAYPNREAAAQALLRNEVQYLESPAPQSVQMLRDDPNVRVGYTDPAGNIGMAVFNHHVAPFNNVAMRRAVVTALSQEDAMTAAFGTDRTAWRTCFSIYPCGTPYSGETRSQLMRSANVVAARQMLERAGYRGETVTMLNPTDNAVISAWTQSTVRRLREIGMTVQVEDMTWDELVRHRSEAHGSPGHRPWSMFHTWWVAADLMNPLAIAFSGNHNRGWVSGMEDAQVERLRRQFATARTPQQAQAAARQLQERLWANANFAVLGQFFEPIAYRSNVTGLQSPVQMYYHLGLQR